MAAPPWKRAGEGLTCVTPHPMSEAREKKAVTRVS